MQAKDIAQIVQSSGVTLGVIVGGGWAWYRFLVQRASETALTIELNFATTSLENSKARFTFADILLQNIGKRRLRATEKKPALRTYVRWVLPSRRPPLVSHSLSMAIRRILPAGGEEGSVSWESNLLKTPVGIEEEMSLLSLFERTRTPFWLEPGESMHFNQPVVLDDGDYMARVIFVGRRRGEVWIRAERFSVSP